MSCNDPTEASAQSLLLAFVAIEVVHFDHQLDGSPVAGQDKLKIVPATSLLCIVGNQLHKAVVVKWETTLPLGELGGVDEWDDVARHCHPQGVCSIGTSSGVCAA